ncbi:propanol-preferring alcohol dehydrogenase [Catenuloplanes nepalensis]|uniref:Propanol-preferring alcohol dehydrogenase n=1 Tax=Catenuloplanes nepalensis TaxID=587533 RepID=A0ABT9MNH4_9ACTN|nr:zinc-binding dehydrogenase [Catenuloplanes nepalensis]MDP9792980.1 propanol-preferring alcohol dehydrogenase [Catenuloplanes nepalensis]
MKAWQLIGTNKPLELTEVADPTPGPGEVVLDVTASGLCHSDVSSMTDPGVFASLAKTPITIGHEIAGVVSAVGEGVTGWAIGDRAGVCPTASAATPGKDGPSAGEASPGYGHDGGFAEKYLARAYDLVRVPDGLDIALGAVATDAGMTSYHALVVRGALKKGMKVGIIGLGGLGQIAARVGVLKGAEVHVAEMKKDVWTLAESLGATSTVSDVSEWRGQGFDLIVDYAGFGTTTAGALKAVRYDGTVVQVGMGKTDIGIDTTDLIINHANLLGSVGGTKDDIADLYALMAAGDLTPQITEITFDQIPQGIDDLRDGKVTGRLVARLGS